MENEPFLWGFGECPRVNDEFLNEDFDDDYDDDLAEDEEENEEE